MTTEATEATEAIEGIMMKATTVQYMERTRAYYRALGYEADYVWAHNSSTPFTPMTKPVAQLRLAVVTTANLPAWRESLPREVWSESVLTPPPSFYTADLAWDKINTHTDDPESFVPLLALQELVHTGVLGELAPRFHGLPSEYSQKKTIAQDAPELLRRLREDGADAVLLVPL